MVSSKQDQSENISRLRLEISVLTDNDVTSAQCALISAQDWQAWFERWLTALKPDLSPIQSYALSLRLTQDRQMQHFNSTFRHIDKPTDVLAFASLEREALPPQVWETQPLELGDIIISVQTAQCQADEHQHSLRQEITWLASHGLLHLLGWDHPNEAELSKMLHQQHQLISLIGLIER